MNQVIIFCPLQAEQNAFFQAWPRNRRQLCRFQILSIDLAEIFERRRVKFRRRCTANKINVIRASKISIRHF
jgi:hypothetical protein